MADVIDSLFNRLGFTGTNALTVQFVIGAGIAAYSVATYGPSNQLVPVLGMLFGAYLVLKSIQ